MGSDFGENHIKLRGPLRGASPFSNRAEATGVPPALLRPAPLHVGVDNPLAVTNLNEIIHGSRAQSAKAFERTHHGDTRKKIETAVRERGPGTTKVTNVKGRATERHVEESTTTAEHREGNNIADNLATKAHDGFHDHFNESANPTTLRTNQYAELVQVFQRTIVGVIEALLERRRTMAMTNPTQQGFFVKGVKKIPNKLSNRCNTLRPSTTKQTCTRSPMRTCSTCITSCLTTHSPGTFKLSCLT